MLYWFDIFEVSNPMIPSAYSRQGGKRGASGARVAPAAPSLIKNRFVSLIEALSIEHTHYMLHITPEHA